MTHLEFIHLAEWVSVRYPSSKAWATDRTLDAVASDFYDSDSLAVKRAAERWFRAGHDRAPSFAHLLADSAGTEPATRPDPQDCRHPRWGVIPEPIGGTPPDKRIRICVMCLIEEVVPADLA